MQRMSKAQNDLKVTIIRNKLCDTFLYFRNKKHLINLYKDKCALSRAKKIMKKQLYRQNNYFKLNIFAIYKLPAYRVLYLILGGFN